MQRLPRSGVPRHQRAPAKGVSMYLIIALVLILLWLGGFVIFHTAGFLIHILLILAVVSFVFHFLRGGSRAA
jgi:hypothetical protein